MNLSEVFNVALPTLPARRTTSYPRVHPKLIMREHIEDGLLTHVAAVSGGSYLYRFSPEQWTLAQLFNGERSYAQVAETYKERCNAAVDEGQVREFADSLADLEFWYKTPIEKNVTASQKLAEMREKEVKKRSVDLSLIVVATWDPDVYVTRLHDSLKFVYSRWFVFSMLALFAFMAAIFIGGWSEIWKDTVEYYTFTHKSVGDLAEFWLLFFGLGFFHETAHALTCKHFGGRVHKTGFMLLYLSPCFFAEITEVYVYGGKWQRISAIIAGIWVELMFCSAASIIWWGTSAGSPIHDFTYKIMLITGVAMVLMNLNPLLKLDGYYLLGELVGVPSMKESSTDYVSSWVKKNIFRLPVEVPYLRRQRRLLFVVYAILSGAYSYVVLFAVVRFCYNIASGFSPQWAFLPAAVLAILIFRTRLRSSWRFMRDLYLDKRQSVSKAFRSWRFITVAAALLLVCFAPVWRDNVSGRFVVESSRRAVIRATVPGEVTGVTASEGMSVYAGNSLLTLHSRQLESEALSAQTDLRSAQAGARQAQVRYENIEKARSEQTYQIVRNRSISDERAALQINTPIPGVVVTSNLDELLGSSVDSGSQLIEVDDLTQFNARIFVPEFQVAKISPGAAVSLKLESFLKPIRGRVSSISTQASRIDPGLENEEKYKGIAPPAYYVVTVPLSNPEQKIEPGMSGDAKINFRRCSIANFILDDIRDFTRRKLW